MRQNIKYYIFIINIIFIILYSFNASFALNNEETEPQKQYQKYEDIKKEHNKDFNKGVYKDEKKDYVKKWISEDINYQKRIIKLKSDYREWATERQSAGKEVIFKEYEPLKSITAAEKEILLEYHNKLFKSKDKVNMDKTVENKKHKKIMPKKPNKQKIIVNKDESSEKKLVKLDLKEKGISAESVSDPEIADNVEIGSNLYIYIILGFALLLIIAECIYLFVKMKNK
jgi:hypothetical protein